MDIAYLIAGLILSKFRKTLSLPEVIIVTGYGDPDGTEIAIKNKAWDYIEKPFSVGSLTLSINRALQYREKKDTGKAPVILKRDGLIGNSPEMQHCLNRLAHAAISGCWPPLTEISMRWSRSGRFVKTFCFASNRLFLNYRR